MSWVRDADGNRVLHGAAVEWYENGQKRTEGSFAHGKRHGRWRSWYANGQLDAEGEVRDDQRVGPWTFWYESGEKQRELEYPEGLSTVWYENGRKWGEGPHRDGPGFGTWTYWHPTGEKWAEGEERGGKKHGPWTYWPSANPDDRRLHAVPWDAYGKFGKIVVTCADGELATTEAACWDRNGDPVMAGCRAVRGFCEAETHE